MNTLKSLLEAQVRRHFGDSSQLSRACQAFLAELGESLQQRDSNRDLWFKHWAIESSLSGIALTDLQANLRHVNPAFLRMWAYTREQEVVGRPAADFAAAPDQIQDVLRILADRGRWEGRMLCRRQDVTTFPVELGVTQVRDEAGEPVGFMVSALDLSERQRSERDLLEVKEQLAATLNALPDLLFAIDRDYRIVDYRAPSRGRLYVPPEAFLGRRLDQVIPPDTAELLQVAVAQAFDAGTSAPVTYSLAMEDTLQWFEMNAARQGRAGAREARVIVLVRDVTTRKAVEEQLRISEARLREAVRVSDIGIFEHDHRTDVMYWSPEQRRIHGWDAEEPVTLEKVVASVHPEHRERVAQAIRDAHDPRGDGRYDIQYPVLHRNGQIRWVVTRSQTLFEGEGALRRPSRTTGALRDITEERGSARALRESEERLRLALAAANQGLYDLDVQTGKAVVSPEYALMLGYDPEHFQETNADWADRLHPGDREEVYRTYVDYIAGKRPEYRVEFRQRTQSGEWKWILSLGKVVKSDAEGRPLRMLGTHTDISDRKRAEEALRMSVERFAFAMEVANDGLWDWHVPIDHSYYSPRFHSMLGFDAEGFDAEHTTWLSLVHPEDCEITRYRYDDLVAGREGSFEIEIRMRHRNGDYLWVLCRAKAVEQDERGFPVRVVGTFSDITARKAAEHRLGRAFDELEARVRERTLELEQAKVAAEAASEAKSRFLAMMSHEIRTPLNGVTGMLYLLEQDSLTSRQKRWLGLAENSAATLLGVINDILDFSKIEAGKLELHPAPTDLLETLAKAASTFRQRALEKGLEWEFHIDTEVPPWVEVDSVRLNQLLVNLLGNAMKFTDRGGVCLKVTRGSDGGGPNPTIRFDVSDTGPGLSADQQLCLFKPFSQVDNSPARRHGGTGLGLGICKQLVELMGGQIGLTSVPGVGSTFWFELPLAVVDPVHPNADPAGPGSSAASPGTSPRPAGRRVLLVEDNEINQELAREMVLAAGCECDCVTNGEGALNAIAERDYALVLMDCMMPGVDGYDATRRIREAELQRSKGQGLPRRVPIIAMTAAALDADRAKCFEAGMDDFLAKPLDPDEVIRLMQIWLSLPLDDPTSRGERTDRPRSMDSSAQASRRSG